LSQIIRYTGIIKYFTPLYWIMKIRFFFAGTPLLHIQEVFTINIEEDENHESDNT
jgi:hypothetical protein